MGGFSRLRVNYFEIGGKAPSECLVAVHDLFSECEHMRTNVWQRAIH